MSEEVPSDFLAISVNVFCSRCFLQLPFPFLCYHFIFLCSNDKWKTEQAATFLILIRELPQTLQQQRGCFLTAHMNYRQMRVKLLTQVKKFGYLNAADVWISTVKSTSPVAVLVWTVQHPHSLVWNFSEKIMNILVILLKALWPVMNWHAVMTHHTLLSPACFTNQSYQVFFLI